MFKHSLGARRATEAVEIASGDSLSAAVELGGYCPCGVKMPSAWTASSYDGSMVLTFQVATAEDKDAFVNLYDLAGNEVSVTVGTSRYLALDPADFIGACAVKIRAGTAAAPAAQAADRSIQLVAVPEQM